MGTSLVLVLSLDLGTFRTSELKVEHGRVKAQIRNLKTSDKILKAVLKQTGSRWSDSKPGQMFSFSVFLLEAGSRENLNDSVTRCGEKGKTEEICEEFLAVRFHELKDVQLSTGVTPRVVLLGVFQQLHHEAGSFSLLPAAVEMFAA